jgi:hypothetical protein
MPISMAVDFVLSKKRPHPVRTIPLRSVDNFSRRVSQPISAHESAKPIPIRVFPGRTLTCNLLIPGGRKRKTGVDLQLIPTGESPIVRPRRSDDWDRNQQGPLGRLADSG